MTATSTGCAALVLFATLLVTQSARERDNVALKPVIRALRTLSAHSARVRCLQFASDGRLASGGRDRLINVWSADGRPLHSIDLRPGGG